MQLQDALTIPKIFIGLDIHKQSWTVSIQTDLFFHKTYSLPSIAEDLYYYVERTFPNHEVNLVYEAGCCGFSVAACNADNRNLKPVPMLLCQFLQGFQRVGNDQ